MDGTSKAVPAVQALLKQGKAVAVCPEVLGGLPTPRDPSEIRDGRVFSSHGVDVTAAFLRGAEETLRICREHGCTHAILKSKSPSCGCGLIHNGQFDGGLVPGNGICAQLLLDAGIQVMTEQEYLAQLEKTAKSSSPPKNP